MTLRGSFMHGSIQGGTSEVGARGRAGIPGFLRVVACLAWIAGSSCASLGARDKAYHPEIDPANFQPTIDNPYFPLIPGTTYHFVEKEAGETREQTFAVTHDTRLIRGVRCVVVHDTLTVGGVLKEDTYDWFAQDKQGTVWYFGEDTKEFLAGDRVSTEGSWESGVDGAEPGIIMPGRPKVGPAYRQEYKHGEAEDMGQIAALNDTVTVPAGSYTGCIRTNEWSMLESGSENKWYAKGIGIVRAESKAGEVVELLSVTQP